MESPIEWESESDDSFVPDDGPRVVSSTIETILSMRAYHEADLVDPNDHTALLEKWDEFVMLANTSHKVKVGREVVSPQQGFRYSWMTIKPNIGTFRLSAALFAYTHFGGVHDRVARFTLSDVCPESRKQDTITLLQELHQRMGHQIHDRTGMDNEIFPDCRGFLLEGNVEDCNETATHFFLNYDLGGMLRVCRWTRIHQGVNGIWREPMSVAIDRLQAGERIFANAGIHASIEECWRGLGLFLDEDFDVELEEISDEPDDVREVRLFHDRVSEVCRQNMDNRTYSNQIPSLSPHPFQAQFQRQNGRLVYFFHP